MSVGDAGDDKKQRNVKHKKKKIDKTQLPGICKYQPMTVDTYNMVIDQPHEWKTHCRKCDKNKFYAYQSQRIWLCTRCYRFLCDSCFNKGAQFLLQPDNSVYLCSPDNDTDKDKGKNNNG